MYPLAVSSILLLASQGFNPDNSLLSSWFAQVSRKNILPQKKLHVSNSRPRTTDNEQLLQTAAIRARAGSSPRMAYSNWQTACSLQN